jgi:hypothetical protein
MMTLSMIQVFGVWASLAQMLENAALLSPCHIQNSRSREAFSGKRSLTASAEKFRARLWTVPMLFLICSQSVLCSSP